MKKTKGNRSTVRANPASMSQPATGLFITHGIARHKREGTQNQLAEELCRVLNGRDRTWFDWHAVVRPNVVKPTSQENTFGIAQEIVRSSTAKRSPRLDIREGYWSPHSKGVVSTFAAIMWVLRMIPRIASVSPSTGRWSKMFADAAYILSLAALVAALIIFSVVIGFVLLIVLAQLFAVPPAYAFVHLATFLLIMGISVVLIMLVLWFPSEFAKHIDVDENRARRDCADTSKRSRAWRVFYSIIPVMRSLAAPLGMLRTAVLWFLALGGVLRGIYALHLSSGQTQAYAALVIMGALILLIVKILKHLAVLFGDIEAYTTRDDNDPLSSVRKSILKDVSAVFVGDVLEGNDGAAYDRVVLMGHSLGSQINYDVLVGLAELVARKGRSQEKDIAIRVLSTVSDFVTYGSPINKISRYFKDQRLAPSDKWRRDIAEKLFGDGLPVDPDNPNAAMIRIRWTNYWCTADPISDPIRIGGTDRDGVVTNRKLSWQPPLIAHVTYLASRRFWDADAGLLSILGPAIAK
jgi:hypothetical protein